MVQAPRSSGNSVRWRARRQPLILAAITICALFFGVAPAACLSDVAVPECVKEGNCSGSSGQASDAGDAGATPQGGSAGSPEQTAGAGGTSPGLGGRGGVAPIDESGAAGVGEAGTAGTPGVCVTCVFARSELPNPCGSDAYATDVSVSGGVDHYDHWQVSATTGTWQVQIKPNSADGSQAILSGSPSGPADLKITVVDGAGYVAEQLYSVTPRTACYFAYVAPDVNGPKLALRDPLLGVDAAGKLTNNLQVYDFQFSPDGRFLAYRYDESPTHPKGAHLSLFNLSTMQDQALALAEDEINAYAWSPDSSVLAAAFTASDVSQLGGVQLSSAAGGTQITALAPVVASDPIESNLFWVDKSFVSFFSATTPDLFTPPGRSSTFYASLGAAGFDAPVPITDTAYKPGIVVAPAPGGLFVTSPSDKRSVYNSVSIDNAFDVDHQTNFVDPAGHFSAAIVSKALELFQAADNSEPFENSSSDPASNCPKLLAWAPSRERIACVASVSQTDTSWGEIRIFDAGSATPFVLAPSVLKGSCLKDAHGTPLAGQCAQTEYDYDEATSAAQPRLLSTSGNWFAFVTGAQSGTPGFVYWADLRTMPMNLTRKIGTSTTTPGQGVALAFSPSERYLLHQNGAELVAHLLSAGTSNDGELYIESSLGAPTTAQCADDFVTAPTRWCGGANGSPSFTWSPDPTNDVLAYRKLDKLIVVDLPKQGVDDPHPFAANVCDETCSGQYAFQPPKP